MVDFAYIFPGQGAQYVGMGRDLYDKFSAARAIYEMADKVLKFELSKISFEGPREELTRTDICQPAILTASVAALKSLESRFSPAISPASVLGLSLGEYTALVCAGSIEFEDALYLVRRRGEFMEEASRRNPGTMASVIGLSLEDVRKICEESGAQIANLNCPGQIVISGAKEKVARACGAAKERGAKRVMPLEVSGAFHSGLMEPAADRLKAEISRIKIAPPKTKVVSNVTARYQTTPEEIENNLIAQVKSPVRWEESIKFLAGEGIAKFVEVGPGKVLNGLLKRIDSGLECFNVEKAEDVFTIEKALSGA